MKARGTRLEVWREEAMQTKSGVRRDDLILHKGSVRTKKELQNMKRYGRRVLGRWSWAFLCARKFLKLRCFVPMKKDSFLYKATMLYYRDPNFGAKMIFETLGKWPPASDGRFYEEVLFEDVL